MNNLLQLFLNNFNTIIPCHSKTSTDAVKVIWRLLQLLLVEEDLGCQSVHYAHALEQNHRRSVGQLDSFLKCKNLVSLARFESIYKRLNIISALPILGWGFDSQMQTSCNFVQHYSHEIQVHKAASVKYLIFKIMIMQFQSNSC